MPSDDASPGAVAAAGARKHLRLIWCRDRDASLITSPTPIQCLRAKRRYERELEEEHLASDFRSGYRKCRKRVALPK